jgi:methylglutaconyl-CoA hydratase
MDETCIKVNRDERGVARVILNRPAVHNAFNQTLIEEMTRIFRELSDDGAIRVVVLEGTGKNFSAGADLEWMRDQAQASDAENKRTASAMAHMFQAIDSCTRPVIGKIQGAALGGGSGLTCVVDIAVASPNALFGFTEVRLGILPAVISPFVIRKIGYSHARARFLTGARFPASEALAIGMVHYVAEDLDKRVEELITDLLAGAPQAQQKSKRLVGQIYGSEPSAHEEITVAAISQARSGAEGREGIAAFLEKRAPIW